MDVIDAFAAWVAAVLRGLVRDGDTQRDYRLAG